VQISLRLDSDLIDYFRGRRAGMANADERGVAEDGGDLGGGKGVKQSVNMSRVTQ
jgi:hypothetical protein